MDEKRELSPADQSSESTEDTVLLRRDSHTLRTNRRQSRERTPTALVSHAFNFLNEDLHSSVDIFENGTVDISDLRQSATHLKDQSDNKACDENQLQNIPEDRFEDAQDSVFVTDSKCKDSGFASLERKLDEETIQAAFSEFQTETIKDDDSTAGSHMCSMPPTNTCERTSDVNNCSNLVEEKEDLGDECFAPLMSSNSVEEISASNNDALSSSDTLKDVKDRVALAMQVLEDKNDTDEDGKDYDEEEDEQISVTSEGEDNNSTFETATEFELSFDKHEYKDVNSNISSDLESGTILENPSPAIFCHLETEESQEESYEDSEREKPRLLSVDNVEDKNSDQEIAQSDSTGSSRDSGVEGQSVESIHKDDGDKNKALRDSSEGVSIREKAVADDGQGDAQGDAKLIKIERTHQVDANDSSDEDTGIYAESFRRSNWIQVSREGKLQLHVPTPTPSASSACNEELSTAVPELPEDNVEEGNTEETIALEKPPPDLTGSPHDLGVAEQSVESIDKESGDEGKAIRDSSEGVSTGEKAVADDAQGDAKLIKIERTHQGDANDSSDEDTGIYAESFRRSNWIRVSREGKLQLHIPTPTPSTSSACNEELSTAVPEISEDNVEEGNTEETIASEKPPADDVFNVPDLPSHPWIHKRSDSTTSTTSESEFQRKYVSRRKCLVQRADSQQEYHRLSARIYEEDKEVIVERNSDCQDLGLHLLDSHPAFITSVDPGSPADKAGIVEGQILVSVNDLSVLTTSHADIIELIQKCKGNISLGVANSDFQPVRDLQAPVIAGYLYKLGHSSLVRLWKKRYFILRQDNCLYYYKNEQELDPLGALPLCGYTILRHTETNKDFCFKADKYGARSYYFMTDSRDQMTEWVGAMTQAAVRSKKRKESFLSVSSHNVSLPALDIRRPECSGFVYKLVNRSWSRRYCVLKDACIYYYKDVNSLSALGVAHLHGYTIDVAGHPKKKNSFCLRPPEPKMRIFNFSADNDTDKKRWVEALIHSIQRWVKVDN